MTPKQIRAARVKLNLTQVQFAKKIGVAPNTVARWERGESTPSTMRSFEKLREMMDGRGN